MVEAKSDKVLVSIILPIRKGEDIKGCLERIELSTYEDYEIIVVDEGLERSKQRNIGIDRANGDYLLILDSDMWVTPELIEECVFLMVGYDSVYIPERIMTKGLFGRVRNFERGFYNGTAVDVVRFVKAKDCPRFDESMSGPEDSDWDRRVKGKRAISKNCFYHYDNVTLKSYCKKKAYYTKSMGKYTLKNPDDKIMDLRWRCWGVFVENGKWRECVRHPFLMIAVMFVLFLRGVIYYSGRKK